MGLTPLQVKILRVISRETGIPIKDMMSSSRKANIVFARNIAYKEFYNRTYISLSQIADIFNKGNHSTVVLALTSLNNLLSTSKKHLLIYEGIIGEIEKEEKEYEERVASWS